MFKFYLKYSNYFISFVLFTSINFFGKIIGDYAYILYFLLSLYLIAIVFLNKVIYNKTWVYFTGLNFILFSKNIISNCPIDVLITDFLNYSLISVIVLGLYRNKLKQASRFFLITNMFLAIYSFYSSNPLLLNATFSGGEEIGEFIGFYRFQGFFGTPGYAALCCALLFLYFLYIVNFNETNYLDHVSLVSSFVLGLWTGNRSFIFAFILIGIFYLLFLLFKNQFIEIFKINYKRLFYISIIFIFFYLINSGSDIYEIYKKYLQNRFESGFDSRISGETGILDVFYNIDIKTFIFGAINYQPAPYIIVDNYFYQPHNALIYFLTGYGIFYFIFVLIFIYSIVFKLFKFSLNRTSSFLFFFIFISFFFSLGEIFLITPIQICFYSLFKIDKHFENIFELALYKSE